MRDGKWALGRAIILMLRFQLLALIGASLGSAIKLGEGDDEARFEQWATQFNRSYINAG